MYSYVSDIWEDAMINLNKSFEPADPHYSGWAVFNDKEYWSHIRILPEINKVIFNNPATIVLWEDGTKTVVKCGDMDIYDPEKGLTMCITKKVMGNNGNYYNEIRKWLEQEDK